VRLPAVLPPILLAASVLAGRAADAPDFVREVRPILATHCFNCHGFDAGARKAGLRLDERAAALLPAKSGAHAIVPGHPEASELLLRVTDSADPMPPAETGKRLSAGEVDILRRWIAAGADYRPHWAFTAPARPSPRSATSAGFGNRSTASPWRGWKRRACGRRPRPIPPGSYGA